MASNVRRYPRISDRHERFSRPVQPNGSLSRSRALGRAQRRSFLMAHSEFSSLTVGLTGPLTDSPTRRQESSRARQPQPTGTGNSLMPLGGLVSERYASGPLNLAAWSRAAHLNRFAPHSLPANCSRRVPRSARWTIVFVRIGILRRCADLRMRRSGCRVRTVAISACHSA